MAKWPFRFGRRSVGGGEDGAALGRERSDNLVKMLLSLETRTAAKGAITERGVEVVPFLLAALKDPAYRVRRLPEPHTAMELLKGGNARPLLDVFDCLVHYESPEVIAAVSGLLHDAEDQVRNETALFLGTVASDNCIEPLQAVLSADDERVGDHAMIGLLRVLDKKDVSGQFRDAVFDAILPLVQTEDRSQAAECLLQLDRERAIAHLTTPEALAPRQAGLHETLRALREARVKVDEAPLLSIVDELESDDETSPHDFVLGEALRALGRYDSERARDAIQRGLKASTERVREGAAMGMALSHGVEDAFGTAFDKLNEVGWEGLTEPQANALAVRILIDEVNNGGFDQYFANSSGDQWEIALAGFERIGAGTDLALLRQACTAFEAGGPSSDHAEREHQLRQCEAFPDDLDESFFEDRDGREVLLIRYIARHAADFR
ncbi:MAG: DUF4375 domain-containing protein [Phycisphaerae bacterium]|jgi:HEAT repeat protein